MVQNGRWQGGPFYSRRFNLTLKEFVDKFTEEEIEEIKRSGCPECGGNIKLYNTKRNGMSGRYRCRNCGRDQIWKVAEKSSPLDALNKLAITIKKGPIPQPGKRS